MLRRVADHLGVEPAAARGLAHLDSCPNVYAVTRRLPEEQRTDVGEELRGTIADRIDTLAAERPDADSTANERLALEELGDPDRLAASYTGPGLHLIGPELYPAWNTIRDLLGPAGRRSPAALTELADRAGIAP